MWDLRTNASALTALMWYHATGERGCKDMVVLPFKDRLRLFSAGDDLHGFQLGTRAALLENGRESMTITACRRPT